MSSSRPGTTYLIIIIASSSFKVFINKLIFGVSLKSVLDLANGSLTVWPDVGIKGCLIFPQIAQKEATAVLSSKLFFEKAKQLPSIWGT